MNFCCVRISHCISICILLGLALFVVLFITGRDPHQADLRSEAFGADSVSANQRSLPPSPEPHQFVYRANWSTEDAITITIILHRALSHLENRKRYMRMLFVDYSSAFSIIIPNILTTKLEHLQGTHISHVTWTHDTNLSHGLSGPHHSVHSHMVSVLRPSSFALPRSLSSNVCLCLVLYIFLWFVYISSVCYLFLHSCCGAPMMSCTTTITAYSILFRLKVSS